MNSLNINSYIIDTRYMMNCEILKKHILELDNKITAYKVKNEYPPTILVFNYKFFTNYYNANCKNESSSFDSIIMS